MKLPIYMDYSATTPVDPRVAEKLCSYLTPDGLFGNPASRSHTFGWDADDAVQEARQNVAALINADPKEIVWTSGATESDNLAIKGVAHFYRKKGKHIITCKTEHKAVLDTCRQLERDGFEITYLDPEPNGLLDLEKLQAAMRDDTILVLMPHTDQEGDYGHDRRRTRRSYSERQATEQEPLDYRQQCHQLRFQRTISRQNSSDQTLADHGRTVTSVSAGD